MNVNGNSDKTHGEISDFELDLLLRDQEDDIPAPSMRLMNAVLADAAEVSASRTAITSKRRVETPRPTGLLGRLEGLLAPLGGWQAATALAVCAVVGFAAGMSGRSDTASSLIWGDTVALDFPSDTVANYFDTAFTEG